jgi:DNA-directed RNA polymerase subunit RPC12/RpoP
MEIHLHCSICGYDGWVEGEDITDGFECPECGSPDVEAE